MDAIFIQSHFGEFFEKEQSRGFLFLQNLLNSISSTDSIDVVLFLNADSFLRLNRQKYETCIWIKSTFADISIVLVDDSFALNPTSYVFSFLMNYQREAYPRVLVLETDCFLAKEFDVAIKQAASKLDGKEWFILGSYYYGKTHKTEEFREHMNGVALYNRSDYFNEVFMDFFRSGDICNCRVVNYDYYLYLYLKSINKFEGYCIDSDLIVNISRPDDSDLNWKQIKPGAVIVHTKEPRLAAAFAND
jgi:hypothetical protein